MTNTAITINGKVLDDTILRQYDCELPWEETEAYWKALEWLSDPANKSDINYSDIYKDVYGVRPC